ncbi:MAG: hypothetical protein ACI9F9_001575 [Candidatus Paceibacteria bacterium]|jgi:hypothetical protein
MRIPRWTTYPAIALILMMVVVALPKKDRGHGAASMKRGEMFDTNQAQGNTLDLDSWMAASTHITTSGSQECQEAPGWGDDAYMTRNRNLPEVSLRFGPTAADQARALQIMGLRLVSTEGVTLSGN